MSLLRILRNLAVLVILTVGSLGLIPRPMAAASCIGAGAACTQFTQCCSHACHNGRCCNFIYGHYCSSSVDCCSPYVCFRNRCV